MFALTTHYSAAPFLVSIHDTMAACMAALQFAVVEHDVEPFMISCSIIMGA